MPATIVAIASAPSPPPSQRLTDLEDALRRADDHLDLALGALGYNTSPADTEKRAGQTDAAGAARSRQWWAMYFFVSCLKRRIQYLEHSIRRVVASDLLTKTQRATLVGAVYGKSAVSTRLPSELEGRLLTQYRSLPPSTRQACRSLLAELSGQSDVDDDGARNGGPK